MKFVTSLLLLLLSINLLAQENNLRQNQNNNRNRNTSLRGPSVSLGIVVMEPQGVFEKQYTGTPAGINGQFLINMGNAPFDFGSVYVNVKSTPEST